MEPTPMTRAIFRLARSSLALVSSVLVACTATACGKAQIESGRPHQLSGTMQVRVTSRSPYLEEEGTLTGAENIPLTLIIDQSTGHMTFVASPESGTFTGTAQVGKYSIGKKLSHFEEIGTTIEGTGRFAHIHSGEIRFRTLDESKGKRITVKVNGTLYY
jgi:hypothetical protein